MTVRQLIEGLLNYDNDLPVFFELPAGEVGPGRHPTWYAVENFNVHFKTVERFLGTHAEPDFLILKDNSR
jgi:hypothetical protein